MKIVVVGRTGRIGPKVVNKFGEYDHEVNLWRSQK